MKRFNSKEHCLGYIEELYEKGKTQKQIAEILNKAGDQPSYYFDTVAPKWSQSNVSKIMTSNGYRKQTRKNTPTEQKIAYEKQLIKKITTTASEIANEAKKDMVEFKMPKQDHSAMLRHVINSNIDDTMKLALIRVLV